MLGRQKEKQALDVCIKESKEKLYALNKLLHDACELSKNSDELSKQTGTLLKSFENDLEPLFKKSQALKDTSLKIDEALKGAIYIYDYLQKAKNLESNLAQKIKLQDLPEYYIHIDEALIIIKFTEKSKNNMTYNEIYMNMTKSIEIAKKQLIDIFMDRMKICLTDMNNSSQIELLNEIDKYLNKMECKDHMLGYISLRERMFKDIIDTLINKNRDIDQDKGKIYKKGTHFILEGFQKFMSSLQEDKRLIEMIFEKERVVYDNIIDRYYKIILKMNDTLISKKTNSIETKYAFLAALDYIDLIDNQTIEIKELVDTKYSNFADLLHLLRDSASKFLKDYSKVFHDDALKLINDKISESSIQLVQFIKELKNYPNACQYLSKLEKLGDVIYRQFFEHFEKVDQMFKIKGGISALFYNMNNKYFLMDSIRTLDLKSLFSSNFLKQLKDSLDRDIQQYIELCWRVSITNNLCEIQVEYDKNEKLKSSTANAIKKKLTDFTQSVMEFEKLNKNKWLSSKDLATKVRITMKNYVLSRYQTFLMTYGKLDFSTTKEKFIKYNIDDLGNLIDNCLIYD